MQCIAAGCLRKVPYENRKIASLFASQLILAISFKSIKIYLHNFAKLIHIQSHTEKVWQHRYNGELLNKLPKKSHQFNGRVEAISTTNLPNLARRPRV